MLIGRRVGGLASGNGTYKGFKYWKSQRMYILFFAHESTAVQSDADACCLLVLARTCCHAGCCCPQSPIPTLSQPEHPETRLSEVLLPPQLCQLPRLLPFDLQPSILRLLQRWKLEKLYLRLPGLQKWKCRRGQVWSMHL